MAEISSVCSSEHLVTRLFFKLFKPIKSWPKPWRRRNFNNINTLAQNKSWTKKAMLYFQIHLHIWGFQNLRLIMFSWCVLMQINYCQSLDRFPQNSLWSLNFSSGKFCCKKNNIRSKGHYLILFLRCFKR